MQECFSFFLQNYGGLILPILKSCLEKLLMECLNHEKAYHFASILHIAIKLGIFAEVSQNSAQVRSKFSTLNSMPLLDFINLIPASFRLENFNLILKFCIEIAENPSHPFKRLATVAIHKLYTLVSDQDESFRQKIIEWKFNRCSLPTFFPFYTELQNICDNNSSDIYASNMKLYTNLYLKSSSSDGLVDLLLIFTSSLIEKALYDQNSNLLKAYEYCLDRILFLSKSESPLIVTTYSDLILTVPDETADWEGIIGSMSEINLPLSFSEWVFCILQQVCSFCKSRESELLRSFLPALIEPFSMVPIMPIFIVTAYYSSGGTFIKQYFKPSVLNFFEVESISVRVNVLIFDILNETFNIFSRSYELSGVENTDCPTWYNQFSTDELFSLFRKCMKLNILKYAEFFMQLLWSVDSKKISNGVASETFAKLDDYRSALCVSSNENTFGMERSLYYFMADQQNSLAESALDMMSHNNNENLDIMMIKNNSLKMNRESFSKHLEKLCRISPNRIPLYSSVKESLINLEYFKIDDNPVRDIIDYFSESVDSTHNKPNANKDKNWDNFRLLNEAKTLRKRRNFENSYYILSKMKFENDSFWTFKHFLELGNWFHACGKFNVAIEIFQSLAKEQKNQNLLSKIYRKLAVSMVSSRHYSDQEIVDAFEKSASLNKNCAKISFEIGSFYDSKVQSNVDRTSVILRNYARALLNSRKYDHLIYPRFITIWLNIPANSQSDKKVYDLMSRFISVASTSQAVNHLSQLISRIGHPKPADALMIEQFLMKIFADYSDVTLWKMSSVAHSNNDVRKNRIISILDKVTPGVKNFDIKGFLEFCRILITICDMPAPVDVVKLSLSKELRTCKRIMSNDMLIAAPNSVLIYSPENKEGYDYIRGFEDHCLCLPSLQRPKKIRFTLNNSRHMTALLKPKDDLRKDCRFMELCRFLNLNFLKHKEKYEIKIYAVTPLNEECGIIEWVDYTASFRGILLKSYKKLGISIAIRDLKDILAMQISTYEKFVKFFLPKFPPIFFRWFFEKFPSVIRWKSANQAYTNSLAVMSMVGFIIGLGDRHGENILFDETTGGCVHVDFNCLFEKGKTLEYPEKVPFRLTQNMEHACGTGGINSSFKSASNSIMNMMWDSKRSILTNLETFLHDPLVEWSKSKKLTNQTSDITNEQASKILKIVERKLNGYIELENFSCQGQVEKLIQHATDKKNLSEMYIGWSAFL